MLSNFQKRCIFPFLRPRLQLYTPDIKIDDVFSLIQVNLKHGVLNTPHIAPKLLREDQRFERCNLTDKYPDEEEQGFQIGDECTPINETCELTDEDEVSWLFYHPQRISLCQNWTFWTERRKQQRDRVFWFIRLGFVRI
jgi:hypothetical protein